MDASKIKRALYDAHVSEKSFRNPDGVDRARAAAQAVWTHRLDGAEAAILANAMHVSAERLAAELARFPARAPGR